MSANAMIGLVVSIGGALLLTALIFAILIGALRTRLKKLSERFPGAIVFNGYQTEDFASALRLLGAGDAAKATRGFGAVVDHQGITLWEGVGHLGTIVTFLWSDGTTITQETVTASNGAGLPGLVIRSTYDGKAITLPVQVAGFRRAGLSSPTEFELAALLARIAELNRGAVAPRPAPRAAPSTALRRRIEPISGWSAARLVRIFLVFSYVVGSASMLIPLSFVLSGARRGDPAPAWLQQLLPVALVVLAVSLLLRLGIRRAVAREKHAGYTTMPRGDINTPYVDPVTHVVLREAGEPQLTKEQLKAAARDRKMAQ